MGLEKLLIHHVWVVFDQVSQVPTDWPFILFLPVLAGLFIAQRVRIQDQLTGLARPAILVGTVLTLLAVFRIAVCYLSTNFIINTYATLFAESSWLLYQGQPLYSSLGTPEHYSIPYGPYGYVIVGFCQHILGPGIFSSKLMPFLATIGASLFLYLALRTQVPWLSALALTALANALQLPLDPTALWPRPEPFLVFAAAGGLWAATRREFWGPILLGFFIGFATDIKVYAFAFFFLAIVSSWRHHKSTGLWAFSALVAVATLLAPFASAGISLGNYVALLRMMDAGRRFMDSLAIENLEWLMILSMITFAPLFIAKREPADTLAVLWKNADLCGALLLSFLVVSHPAGLEGSGPHQLLPFIPVCVYLATHLLDSPHPSKPRQWSWPGLSLALSIVLFVESYAVLQGLRQPASFGPTEKLAEARIEDIRQIFADRMPCVILNAAGSNFTRDDDNDSYRAILIFNGMPIGIDATPTMDYESLGYKEPDLSDFVARVEARYSKPIVWICPKGTAPFTERSYFGSNGSIFSDQFVSDFHRYFQPAGSTACFDLYELKTP